MSAHLRPPTIAFRRGRVDDASALALFAARTFAATFGHATPPDDLESYLELSYGTSQQGGELADPDVTTILGWSGAELACYAQVRTGETPTCIQESGTQELHRFYVDTAWHGRGIAHVLMDEVFQSARQRGASHLWLSVWEENARAIGFYRKAGFDPVGTTTFMVGTDAQVDRILLARVPSRAFQRS